MSKTSGSNMHTALYGAVLAARPDFEYCLGEIVGPESMNGGKDHHDMTRAEWVERYVEGVVAMPFEAISLDETNVGPETGDRIVRYAVVYSSPADVAEYGIKYMGEGDRLRQTLDRLYTQHEQLVVLTVARTTKKRSPDVPYYREEIMLFGLSSQDDRKLRAHLGLLRALRDA